MTTVLRRVCVMCGSNAGVRHEYLTGAREVGRVLASRGIGVVYGGASVGLMGGVAEAALAEGGEVIGVITPDLARQVGHRGLALEHVATMHERKRRFSELSDAYVALPGGLGTLDELFETLTWNQLGIHHRPAGLLNVDGYFDGLLHFLRHVEGQGFVRNVHLAMLQVDDDANRLVDRLVDAARAGSGAHSKWRED